MRDPRAVQRRLAAAVASPDDIGRNRADKGVERLRADRVEDALADPLRIDARRGEALRQCRLLGADLPAAHMIRAVAGAAGDVCADRARAQYRDPDIAAFQFLLQRLGEAEGGIFARRIRPLVRAAAALEAGDRGGVDDMSFLAVL